MTRSIAAFLFLAAASMSALPAGTDGHVQSGTGFFITSDGYFVTSHHVVAFAPRVTLTLFNQKVVSAEVVAMDFVHDLALLKAEGQFNALAVADSRPARRGWSVMTVGYPQVEIQGVEPKVTRGIINSLTGIENSPRVFQVDLPIQPGSSGGPLVTDQGWVIGVIAHRLNSSLVLAALGTFPQNINYAVKSEHLLALIDKVPLVRPRMAQKPRRPVPNFPALTEYVEEATAIVQVPSSHTVVKDATIGSIAVPVVDQPDPAHQHPSQSSAPAAAPPD